MTTRRRAQFLKQVAEAALAHARHAPVHPRGRPVIENLTDDGRRKGMEAIRQAPRCCAQRVTGARCKNPAMRGATRCVKHGGRVEVPAHPHNIRRFLTGEMGREAARYGAWAAMSYSERVEFIKMLPAHVLQKKRLVVAAAALWLDLKDQGYLGHRRFLDEVARM